MPDENWHHSLVLQLGNSMLHTFGNRGQPTLLLLHGVGIGHRLWRRQIDHFQATHFVIAPDIPGLTSPAGTRDADIIEIAAKLDEALHEQKLGAISVCGISAGASVALALAARAAENIRHLILSAPQARAPRLPLAMQIAVCSIMPELMLLRMARRMVGSDDEIATAAEDLNAFGKAGLLQGMRALWRLDLRDRLSSIAAPTWVLCGGKDKANIPAARFIAAAIPHATLRIEPDVGHLWNIQDPIRFNTVLAEILPSGN